MFARTILSKFKEKKTFTKKKKIEEKCPNSQVIETDWINPFKIDLNTFEFFFFFF